MDFIGESSSEVQAVAKLSNSKEIADRRKALDLLTAIPNWTAQNQLVMNFFEDPDADLQKAIIALVAKTDPLTYITHLRHFASIGTLEIKKICLDGLLKADTPRNVTTYFSLLATSDTEMRGKLEATIANHVKKADETVLEGILNSICDPDITINSAAMSAFMQIEDKLRAITFYIHFSKSVSEMVRTTLFEQARKHPQFFTPLISEMLKKEVDSHMRIEAINLAKEIKHNEIGELLILELDNSDWLVKRNAIQSLGEMKYPPALLKLVTAMDDSSVTIAAVSALDKFREPALLKEFLKRLVKADETAQIEIIGAVKNISGNDERLIPSFLKFIESSYSSALVKTLAADLIKQISQANNKPHPPELAAIEEKLAKAQLVDIPDLGLKLSKDI